MIAMMKHRIFVDLDETLISTVPLSYFFMKFDPSKLKPDEVALNLGTETKPDWYVAKLRSGALELLAALRTLPNTEILMLTTAITAYAKAFNTLMNLGFVESEIYAREDQRSGQFDPGEHRGYVAIIDNLSEYENESKIRFVNPALHAPGIGVAYYQITAFTGRINQDLKPADITKILDFINTNITSK
jgi:hypothetical protein